MRTIWNGHVDAASAVARHAASAVARRAATALAALLLASTAAATTFEVAEASEANYRVREQFAGINFPDDVVGVTGAVDGRIALDGAGGVLDGSLVTVGLAALTSDEPRRDDYVRNNTLQTARFPTADFVPTRVTGLAFPLASSGAVEVEITGELTLRGVTRPVTWHGIATFERDVVRLEAATTVTFTDFELTRPRFAAVLGVADEITLEIRLHLRRMGDDASSATD